MSAARRPGVFNPLVVLMLVAVGVFSFGALVVLSAFASDLRSGEDGGGHALSSSAIGFAGVAALAGELGRPVVISRGGEGDYYLDEYRLHPPLMIYTPSAWDGDRLDERLFDYQRELVVLPKWETRALPTRPGWVTRAGVIDVGEIERLLHSVVDAADKASAPDHWGEIGAFVERNVGVFEARLELSSGPDVFTTGGFEARAAGPIQSFQTIGGEEVVPILVDQFGRTVLGDVGSIYVLSDPDLLSTHGVANADTARAGLALLDELAGPEATLMFDVTLHGYERSRNLLQLILTPPFLPATICLAAAALLAGWHAAVRTGPARTEAPAHAPGKAALIDNSAALFRLTRKYADVAPGYVALTRSAAAQQAGAPAGLSEAKLAALLDEMSRTEGLEVTFTGASAGAGAVRTEDELLALARRLFRWRREITRERG